MSALNHHQGAVTRRSEMAAVTATSDCAARSADSVIAPALPLSTFWRTVAADQFDIDRINAIQAYIAVSARGNTLRAHASRAIGEALKFRKAKSVGAEFDAAMTELLVCAFKDPAAALVLSCMLRTAPLHHRTRARLATSWLAHNLKRAALGSRAIVARHGGDR